jgi:tetratricopeptide (TPR) repeat protein
MGIASKVPIPFPLPEDLTGSKVGRFAIQSKLGAGGMGDVYYAEDTTLHRPVAIKRLARRFGSDAEARRRILREAQRASALTSERIASIHDVLEECGEVFVVMEYVKGETLRQRLQQPMTLEQFFQIATQCAEGLMAAHEHDIVHCDIKPENIMLTPEGQVKILDFGLAKHRPCSDQSSTLGLSSTLAGTPAYMAPEVLLAQAPDSCTDLFSLGVVLYEMLTLKHPFLKGNFVATSERILHETPTAIRVFNSNVPEALEAIIMKTMAKAPAQRYANARELLEDLRRVRAGELPAKLTPILRPSKERKVRRWLVAAVVLLAVVSAFAISRWIHRQPVLAERGWVLIADFETPADEAIPDKGVREGLTIALQQSRYVNVFPRTRVYEVLRRMKKQDALHIDETLGREICQREHLQVLLSGSIERMGQVFQITVRAVDPVQGNLLFAERERFDRRDQFFDKVDSLAKEIRADLGESLGGIEKTSRPLAKVTTRSLEALHLYSQAEDAKDQGKDEQIEDLLKGALRLDPDFAMAHMRLGQYYAAVVGRNETASAELDSAYQLRQEVTDREQRRIEAAFYDLQERYNEKAQSLRVLVSLYPDDEVGHSELAAAYYDLGQLDQAILEAQKTLRLSPSSAPAYGGLVLYLARDNRANAAIDAAREAEQRGLGSPRMHWGLGLAYLGQGNVSAARQEFERIGGSTETDRDLRALCRVVADLYEGRLAAARGELAKQIQAVPPQSRGLNLFRRYLLGRIYLIQGNPREAELQADLMFQTPGTSLHGADFLNAGILYARGGRLAKARQVLRRLGEFQKRTLGSSNQDNLRNLEGEIWLADAKPGQAEISFSVPCQAFSPFIAATGRARAYQAERRWELAAAEWQKVLDQSGEILQSGFPPDLAVTHLELARVYHRMNGLDLARKHYEEALRMWQHADELNLLRDAKREYQELGA